MNTVVLELDSLRSTLLRFMMKSTIARSIFVDRALRLGFSFVVSFATSLILAAICPIWMIVLGPLVLGIPHLFSVVRYLPALPYGGQNSQRSAQRRLRYGGAVLIFAVGIVRHFPIHHSLGIPNFWEIVSGIALILIVAGAGIVGARGALRSMARDTVASLAILSLLALASWMRPLLTLGALAFGHNLIAFVIWVRMAKNAAELRVALLALGMFCVATFAFFTHVLDPIAALGSRIPDPRGILFDPFVIANQIFPSNRDVSLLPSLLSAYAFGQSMHYFVWLKVIPEQSLVRKTPLSFGQSLRAWHRESGWILTSCAIALSVLSIGALFVFNWETLRSLYLALASSHGYLEIAALPFGLRRSVS